MSEENVEIVRRIAEDYAAGDDQAVIAVIDPNVEFDASRFRPDGEIYKGLEAMLEAQRTWRGTFADWKLEILEVRDGGDDVLVAGRESGRGKGSGAPIDQTFFAVFTLRDGKIIRWRHFSNRAEALEAAGLSE
jgi:ketosteroid isomerase-like protein